MLALVVHIVLVLSLRLVSLFLRHVLLLHIWRHLSLIVELRRHPLDLLHVHRSLVHIWVLVMHHHWMHLGVHELLVNLVLAMIHHATKHRLVHGISMHMIASLASLTDEFIPISWWILLFTLAFPSSLLFTSCAFLGIFFVI